MKKQIILLLILLLVVPQINALSFEKQTINKVIIPQLNIPAEVELTITNAPLELYNIYTVTGVELFPSEYFQFEGNKTINLTIYPTPLLSNRGSYTFAYYINDRKNSNILDYINIRVVDFRNALEIYSDTNFPSNSVKFYIKNKEDVRIPNLTAELSSILFKLNQTFDLEPLEEKEFIFDVNESKMKSLPAGPYLLEATFNLEDTKEKISGNLKIGESQEILSESKTGGFLVRTQTEKKSNLGNTREPISITLKKSILLVPFTFTSLHPDKTKTSLFQKQYTWTRELGPSEEIEVIVKTNYLIPLLIILLSIGLVSFIITRSTKKIEIRKTVSPLRTKGGEFALRVNIHIKSKKDLSNATFIEKIPKIVKLDEKNTHPSPLSYNEKNNILKWEVGDLSRGESRSLSYVVYSKVGVMGEITVPKSKLVFEDSGKYFETFSNRVLFISEQIKKPSD